jgi:hypothetical protein
MNIQEISNIFHLTKMLHRTMLHRTMLHRTKNKINCVKRKYDLVMKIEKHSCLFFILVKEISYGT